VEAEAQRAQLQIKNDQVHAESPASTMSCWKTVAETMAAKESAAKLEGEVAALRSTSKPPEPAPLSWWRWLRSTG
jgi:hypothetical protein